MAKIGHSESIWTTLVAKYWKSFKIAVLNQFIPLWWENIGKL